MMREMRFVGAERAERAERAARADRVGRAERERAEAVFTGMAVSEVVNRVDP
jgi:hypothetical protein